VAPPGDGEAACHAPCETGSSEGRAKAVATLVRPVGPAVVKGKTTCPRDEPPIMAAAMGPSKWKSQRRRVFHSVFQTDISLPTPYNTPVTLFTDQGRPFGGPGSASALPGPALSGYYAPPSSGSRTTADLAASPAPQLQNPSHTQPTHWQHAAVVGGNDSTVGSSVLHQPTSPIFQVPIDTPAPGAAADDQISFDRAWHVVTSRIALPSSVAAEDSFGTLAAESQLRSQAQEIMPGSDADFNTALRLVVCAKSALPRAQHTEDIVDWHTHQTRHHFLHHVLPMLAACADAPGPSAGASTAPNHGNLSLTRADDEHVAYKQSLTILHNSIRTLEAALRLYFYPVSLIVRGTQKVAGGNGAADTDSVALASLDAALSHFKRDVHALVANSASPWLMKAIRHVSKRLIRTILGVRGSDHKVYWHANGGQRAHLQSQLQALDVDDTGVHEARQQLHELVDALSSVGLAGERFQYLFAELMDMMMSDFIKQSYTRLWISETEPHDPAGKHAAQGLKSHPAAGGHSPCIASLYNWTENHYARLVLEVLSRVSESINSVPLSEVKKWKEMGLGRLAHLRISELYDIVLSWPRSKGGLDDLRASITTTQRRSALVSSFSAAYQNRLLHPARSTQEILQFYTAMIRTFHALDHSNVLLSRAVGPLQLYLCQRDDAVRIVVTGLLATPEEVAAAAEADAPDPTDLYKSAEQNFTPVRPASTSRPSKLVELAVLLNDPAQQRRQRVDEGDPDWDDMEWLPDPVDAGANYKRPRSEDVVGTIISALGSQDVFIKEFQVIIAERLLSAQSSFDQEVKVLDLLKKRFGETALQNCDVMIKDINDSKKVDVAIRRSFKGIEAHTKGSSPATLSMPAAVAPEESGGIDQTANVAAGRFYMQSEPGDVDDGEVRYRARILSRLFWPSLPNDPFLLPAPVASLQKRYEAGYELLKSSRRLAWLAQLGQATVELELADRTLEIECRTYEAALIYAFQEEPLGKAADTVDSISGSRRSVMELVEMLRMDEDLVREAVSFWMSKGVLAREPGDDEVYTVVETQSSAGRAGAQADRSSATTTNSGAAQPGPASGGTAPLTPRKAAGNAAASRAVDARERAQRQVYWQFIVGMLTNSAASMPLAQIAMMMKMLIAEGFPWSNEELQEFLAEKVGDGELEVQGGKYKLVKKA